MTVQGHCFLIFLHENNGWWDMELVQNRLVGLWSELLSQYKYAPVRKGVKGDDATGGDDDIEW